MRSERRRWTDRWVLLFAIPFFVVVAVFVTNKPETPSTLWAALGIGAMMSAPIILIISFIIAARHTNWIKRLRTPVLLAMVGGTIVAMSADPMSGDRLLPFMPKSVLITNIGWSLCICAMAIALILFCVGLFRSFVDRKDYL